MSQNSSEQSEKRWRFKGAKVHLTYKGHLDHQGLLEFFNGLFDKSGKPIKVKKYSIVWESGHNDPENPYHHTHALIMFEKQVEFKAQSKFDYTCELDGIKTTIHPNIQPVTTDLHFANIWKYHDKEQPTIRLTRSADKVEKPKILDMIAGIKRAPNLAAACDIAGVTAKSVSDVLLLRQDRETVMEIPKLKKRFVTVFNVSRYEHWDRHSKALYLCGRTGIGKTRWAIDQFHNPLLIRCMDDVKNFRSDMHDGLVFDDISFKNMEFSQIMNILDVEMPATIKCRYFDGKIPAGTCRIICTNTELEEAVNHLDDEHVQAIKRRVFNRFIGVDELMFDNTRIEYNEDIAEEVLLRAEEYVPRCIHDEIFSEVMTEDYSLFNHNNAQDEEEIY